MDIRKIEYELPAEDRYPESEYGWRGIVPAKNLGIARPLIDYRWSATTVSSDYVTDGIELVTNGGFDSDTTGWTQNAGGTSSVTDGICTLSRSGGLGSFTQTMSMSGVSRFLITIHSGSLTVYIGGSSVTGLTIGNNIIEVNKTGSVSIEMWCTSDSSTATFDNISVQKVIQKPNTMYLTDTGSKPKYPAEMKSGQGVKFNGVDQNIIIDNFAVAKSSLFTLTSGIVNTFIFNAWISRNTIGENLYLSYYDDGAIYKTYSCASTANKMYFYIELNGLELKIYGDGVLCDTLTLIAPYHTSISYQVGSRGGAAFKAGITKDVYAFTDTLTTTEISKYSTNPNGFYQDVKDGVIDNCVLNMPLNGSDKYVKDDANYSETPKHNDDCSSTVGWVDGFATGVTRATVDGALKITYGTGGWVSTSKPIDIPVLTGEDVLVTFTIVDSNMTLFGLSLSDEHTGLGANSTSVLSISDISSDANREYSIVTTLVKDMNHLVVWNGNGLANSYVTIDNISVKQLSGIHEIANYTVGVGGCRTDTSNLNYGTQELNFLRDGLWRGDLSSYLECNGSGYVDTGWIPNLTDIFVLEATLEQRYLGKSQIIGSTSFTLGWHAVNGYLLTMVFGSEININGLGVGTHKILIHLKTATLYDIWIDGVLSRTDLLKGASVQTTPFLLGSNMETPVETFKVHTDTTTALANYLKEYE